MARSWVVDRLGELAELSGSELTSLLLELMRRRRRTPAEVLAQYQRDRFTVASPVDQRTAVVIDAHLLAAAEAFEAIELSPVAPLGVCTSVALTDQNRVLSALRQTEVVSDPTNVLALECALRIKRGPAHLATSQRVVRAQPVPPKPGHAQHFRIFVLASGGIETVDHGFTVDTLALHVRTMIAALDRLEQHGYTFGARRLDVLATPERAALADRLAAAITTVPVERKPLDKPYYHGLRYMLMVTATDGSEVHLCDGGVFDWLAKLTANRRAVFVASGMGAQLVSVLFRETVGGDVASR